MAEEGLAKAARALLPGLDADGLRSWMMSFWFGDRMRGPGHAASEDRTHDLRIMRPTRYQLRYRRRCGQGAYAHGRRGFPRQRMPRCLASMQTAYAHGHRASGADAGCEDQVMRRVRIELTTFGL